MARPPAADHNGQNARPARDPGDAWVTAPTGERYWGRFGAAGLLVHDPGLGVLLQHRAEWSHFGGTWGIPGGALQQGEGAVAAALRESHEEAAVPLSAVRAHGTRVIDREVWSYTTVISEVIEPFDPIVGDAESVELAWVPIEHVAERPLHPAFGQAWPVLAGLLAQPTQVVLVDAANVVGSVPNGWWKDRRGAAQKLIDRLAQLEHAGLPATPLGLDATTWHAEVDVVVEGDARGALAPAELSVDAGNPGNSGRLSIVDAPGSGDDAIVAQAQVRLAAGARVIVVTSDRELRARVAALGAEYRGTNWLLEMLP